MIASYENRTVDLSQIYSDISKKQSILNSFPKDLQDSLKETGDITVVEIADRDSIAAAIKAIHDGLVREILPVADVIPPEYGNINKAFAQMFWLKKKAEVYGAKIHDLVFIEYEDLYNILTARYSEELISKYGFYSPCLTCHLYFHTVRVPLVRALGGTKIVGGERDSHDGFVKTSQIPKAIDYYIKAVKELGGELLLPVRNIQETREIVQLSFEDNLQLSCMFKQMYGNLPTRIIQNEGILEEFFEDFAVPLSVNLIRELTTNPEAKIMDFADSFVRGLLNNHR